MDPLHEEEKNPGDSNPNSGPCVVNDKISEGIAPCVENNKPDEKDITTSFLTTDENSSPSRELLKCDAGENSNIAASFSIADEKHSPREANDDFPNNNSAESFKSRENIGEEDNLQEDAMEILTSVDVTVTVKKETDVNDVTASLITDENNVPNPNNNDITDLFIAPETIGNEIKNELPEEVPEIKTESSMEDNNQKGNPKELDNKDDSGDDDDDDDDDDDHYSVDSSSDSSSSSSSTASSTSGSSSNDEMNVENDDVDDVVELPKKLSPVIEEKPEELKAILENGENASIPDFPVYRDNDGRSWHDSSSEDSTSSASDVEDDTTDQSKNQRSSSRKNSESEERRPRVKGEIFPEELPALENLNICVGDDVNLQMLGKITSVIMNIAVVRAEFASPIDQDSIVFLKDRTCIGKVHDIIGPVLAPFYTVLLDKDNLSIPVDTEIFCAPQEEEYTKYVFMSDLKNLKGSDASWEHDIEPPQKFLDFSDDEQERLIKKKNKCKNSAENNVDGRFQQKDYSASGLNKSYSKKWRKTGHKKNVNSNAVQDAPQQRSMFACNAAWPPVNGHGSITSWPPPTPPPVPPTPPPSNFQPPNNPTFYPPGQPSHPTWYSSYPESPQPSQQHPFQSPWLPHQNPSNLNPYQHPPPPSRPPFIPPPSNQRPFIPPPSNQRPFIPPPSNQPPFIPPPSNQPPFIPPPSNQRPFIPPPPNQQPCFQGQWRQPYHLQEPPRPPGSFDCRRYPRPRFSQPPQFPGYFP